MAQPLGTIWKVGRAWKIQMPHGILTTRTKAEAKLFAESVSR